jgi:hypothetical protein
MPDQVVARHVRTTNYLVGLCNKSCDSVLRKGSKNINKISRKQYIAGHLMILSSCDYFLHSFNKIKTAKRLTKSEVKTILPDIKRSFTGISWGLETTINHKEDFKNKEDRLKLFKTSLVKIKDVLNNILDLSETVKFQDNGKTYFYLQDKEVFSNLEDLFKNLEDVNLIDKLTKSKDSKVQKVAIEISKSIKALKSQMSKVTPSSDNFDLAHVASSNGTIQILSNAKPNFDFDLDI